MSKITGDGFRKIADGFRETLTQQAKNAEKFADESEEKNPQKVASEAQALEEEKKSEPQVEETKLEGKKRGYYFNEKKIRVSRTHVEFGKFTYVLKFLASVKRTNKKQNKIYCFIGIGVTLVALIATFYNMRAGYFTDESTAGKVLTLALLLFLGVIGLCRSMKSRYTLEFKNDHGETVYTVKKHKKDFIDRLEAAVKKAIEENT